MQSEFLYMVSKKPFMLKALPKLNRVFYTSFVAAATFLFRFFCPFPPVLWPCMGYH